ncbi:hypothetical protein [Paenibacillus sp. MMS18-CY102]|uniref:hypothetical protein n=1 Tax=Paenibacillus sp. MMS18-CY102 TaxID=2682849 RepID=UPI0013657477|nr:hypothetical protein [Paenibacillus sp. MMS18-CY102]MWC29383.1 hypothetical protein [Paenibacillus sp. MMS18-CY102]
MGGEPSHTEGNKANTVTITPIDLFKGGGKKFQPFLGPMSGAFKLRYEGTKQHASLDIEIWKNGKKTGSAGSLTDLFFKANDQSQHEIEFIISAETIANMHNTHEQFTTIKISSIRDEGSALYTFTTPRDEKLTSSGLILNTSPQRFADDAPVYVMGVHATSTGMIPTADFSPESLSQLEYALLFTLHFS